MLCTHVMYAVAERGVLKPKAPSPLAYLGWHGAA
jgi:hypothetical protein